MDVEEIWIHDTPARFPRAHSFCARSFFLDSFICVSFLFLFKTVGVCLHLCVEQFLHATTTTTPFPQRARRTHTHTHPISKGLSYFCFFEFR